MDRISDDQLNAVLAKLEASALSPPDDLDGEARAMFVAIADNNKSRPWSEAHGHALAAYCRVVVMWDQQMKLIATEGPLIANKPNPRLKVTQLLSAERLRLAKLLGLHVGPRDQFLGGGRAEQKAREAGASMAKSSSSENGDLLA